MVDEPVPLSHLSLDIPAEPPLGWRAELDLRGVAVIEDDLGRPALSRADARALFTERREQEEEAARRREAIEQRAIAADAAFRAALPRGVPAGAIPTGVTAAELLMLSDPEHAKSQRESVLQHALAHRGGAVYHPLAPIGGEPA
jgi:hypothetical protein